MTINLDPALSHQVEQAARMYGVDQTIDDTPNLAESLSDLR